MKALYFIVVFLSQLAFAKVEVMFLEIRQPDGNLLILEPNGRFAHLAIRVGERWLHSHPRTGVELREQMKDFGSPAVVLSNDRIEDLSREEMGKYLSASYDFSYDWTSEDFLYCSELVGKILKLEPEPMSFEAGTWNSGTRGRAGELGLSPDDIYRLLKERAWQEKVFGAQERT